MDHDTLLLYNHIQMEIITSYAYDPLKWVQLGYANLYRNAFNEFYTPRGTDEDPAAFKRNLKQSLEHRLFG